MRETVRGKIVLAAVLLLAAGAFGAGINWGLPSKSVDSYFFSANSTVMTDSREAYKLSGAGISHLAGDVEQPIDRSKTVTLVENGPSADPQQDAVNRARILRNFRLNSCDPDERATLDALERISPEKGQLDPKLYHYGGMWFYPLWGIAKFASAMNWVKLSSDSGFYLDHPDEAARMYLLVRIYSAFWGLIAVCAVFGLARKLTANVLFAGIAAAGFIVMPAVLTSAHEATPQLAGAAMTMMALLAAMRYIEEGKGHWMLLASAACGMAAGMTMASGIAFLIIPLMAVAVGGGRACFYRDCFLGLFIAVVIFLAADPMIAIRLIDPKHYADMGWTWNSFKKNYPIGTFLDSGTDAVKLIAESMSWPLAVAGLLGIILLPMSFKSTETDWREEFSTASVKASRLTDEAGLLWAMGLLALVAFGLFAAGRPASYSRASIFADAILIIVAITAFERFMRPAFAAIFSIAVVAAGGIFGYSYYQGFLKDASPGNTRSRTAVVLNHTRQSQAAGSSPSLAVAGNAQPWDMPPADLFGWKIVVLPRGESATNTQQTGDVTVGPVMNVNVMDRFATPLSWASRTYVVRQQSGGKTQLTYVGP
jgi:hypothetical protein